MTMTQTDSDTLAVPKKTGRECSGGIKLLIKKKINRTTLLVAFFASTWDRKLKKY